MEKKKIYFRINEYIVLVFEDDNTNIYVNDVLFKHCKYLLLNIDYNKIAEYDDINSIDEAIEIHRNLYKYETRDCIDPKTEFIGHCSNLQVWVENDYNTRLLHSNLSFPLLKKLAEVGDPVAKKVFKDEVAMRIDDGNENVILFLLKEHYLDGFTKEELDVIYDNIIFKVSISLILDFLVEFKKLGVKKALDMMFDMVKNTKLQVGFDLLHEFSLEQLQQLYDETPEENQMFLKRLNEIMTGKWLISKEKNVKSKKDHILDFRYENP